MPHNPNATYQVQRSSAFWFWRRRFLKGFYHIWAWRPSWKCDQDHLNKLLFPRPKESPYEIWVQLAQWFQRRRCLKMLTDGRRTDGRTDGQQSDWYTISSPMSLRLRWAKNWYKQSPPPSPLELSGSAHACPTVEFYFSFVAGLAIILSRANWLRWCAGWSAPLLFACNSNNVPMEWGKKKQTLIRHRDHLKAVQMPNCVELSSK